MLRKALADPANRRTSRILIIAYWAGAWVIGIWR